MDGSDRYVSLSAGLVIPIEPYLLVFELENEGFSLRRDGDVLVVSPSQKLTPDLCARIRRWKFHVLALLDYTLSCATRPAVQ